MIFTAKALNDFAQLVADKVVAALKPLPILAPTVAPVIAPAVTTPTRVVFNQAFGDKWPQPQPEQAQADAEAAAAARLTFWAQATGSGVK